MTDPMLPVGRKMRRTTDGHEAVIEGAGVDWAAARMAKGGIATLAEGRRSRYYDVWAVEWVPVTEPGTWDVYSHEGEALVFPTGHYTAEAPVYVDASLLPDPSIVDDLAHCICRVIEMWETEPFLRALADTHRVAQTEREAQS